MDSTNIESIDQREVVDDILSDELISLVDSRLRSDLYAFLADSTEDDFIFVSPPSAPASSPTLTTKSDFETPRRFLSSRLLATSLCLLIALSLSVAYVVPFRQSDAPSEDGRKNAFVDSSESHEKFARENLWDDALTFVNFENKKEGEDWNALLKVTDLGVKKLAAFEGSKLDSTFASFRAANPVEFGREVAAIQQNRKERLLSNVAEIDWGCGYDANIEELNAVVADSLTSLDCLAFLDPLVYICNNVLAPSDDVR